MPFAAIAFDFDPLLRLADGVVVRWQAVVLIAIVAAALVATGLIGRRDGLRADDLLFIAVATVPGAVIGGRLGYVLLHRDYYGAHLEAIVDPAQGSLELVLAVVGGTLSGAYIAALLGAPIGGWLRAAALPLLFVLGAGKLAMVLGGSGQGQPADLPWTTAFAGVGPWGSLAPTLPSHPSQLYEGLVTLVLLVLLISAIVRSGAFPARDSRLFFAVLGGFAIARAALSPIWRDPVVAVGLNAGGLIAVAVALGSAVAYTVVARRHRVPGAAAESATVAWADPEARPRF